MFPLVPRGDKLSPAIELIDDIEDRVFSLLGRRAPEDKLPYQEMGRRALILR
jgi:hypothetical protein